MAPWCGNPALLIKEAKLVTLKDTSEDSGTEMIFTEATRKRLELSFS